MQVKKIVACVPVAVAPDHPAKNTYSIYEQVDCPECGNPMWLGARSKIQVERGAVMLCMYCLSNLDEMRGINNFSIIKLTDLDQ
jgi:hypothetical protein